MIVGLGFGLLQAAARRRLERRQNAGRLNNGWAIMPGSMTRVAALLAVLGGVQILCPMLFTDGVQWAVSVGVVLGYGVHLFETLRVRRAALRRN